MGLDFTKSRNNKTLLTLKWNSYMCCYKCTHESQWQNLKSPLLLEMWRRCFHDTSIENWCPLVCAHFFFACSYSIYFLRTPVIWLWISLGRKQLVLKFVVESSPWVTLHTLSLSPLSEWLGIWSEILFMVEKKLGLGVDIRVIGQARLMPSYVANLGLG